MAGFSKVVMDAGQLVADDIMLGYLAHIYHLVRDATNAAQRLTERRLARTGEEQHATPAPAESAHELGRCFAARRVVEPEGNTERPLFLEPRPKWGGVADGQLQVVQLRPAVPVRPPSWRPPDPHRRG